MRKITTLITLLCISGYVQANNFWLRSDETSISTNGEQRIFPNQYQLAKLDIEEFKFFQFQIPTEAAGDYPVIELPKPNGQMAQYYIFDAPIMAPALADRYPMIKTYTLVDTKNPLVTGKADFTYWGFHAKVFDGSNTYFIDPYKHGNTTWYMTYYKRDYSKPLNERMHCLVDSEEDEENALQSGGVHLQNHLPQLDWFKKDFWNRKKNLSFGSGLHH